MFDRNHELPVIAASRAGFVLALLLVVVTLIGATACAHEGNHRYEKTQVGSYEPGAYDDYSAAMLISADAPCTEPCCRSATAGYGASAWEVVWPSANPAAAPQVFRITLAGASSSRRIFGPATRQPSFERPTYLLTSRFRL